MLVYQRVRKNRPRRDWTYKKDVFVFGPICFRQIYGSEEKNITIEFHQNNFGTLNYF